MTGSGRNPKGTLNAEPNAPLENVTYEQFVQLIAGGMSRTNAYAACGYKYSSVSSRSSAIHEILMQPAVSARLKYLRSEIERLSLEKAVLNREWVLRKLKENVERAMEAVPVLDNKGKPTGEYRYDGAVANRALELIGKELGMFADRTEVTGDITVTNLIDRLNQRRNRVTAAESTT